MRPCDPAYRDTRGGSSVEYLLLAGFIIVVALGAVKLLGMRANEKGEDFSERVARLDGDEGADILPAHAEIAARNGRGTSKPDAPAAKPVGRGLFQGLLIATFTLTEAMGKPVEPPDGFDTLTKGIAKGDAKALDAAIGLGDDAAKVDKLHIIGPPEDYREAADDYIKAVEKKAGALKEFVKSDAFPGKPADRKAILDDIDARVEALLAPVKPFKLDTKKQDENLAKGIAGKKPLKDVDPSIAGGVPAGFEREQMLADYIERVKAKLEKATGADKEYLQNELHDLYGRWAEVVAPRLALSSEFKRTAAIKKLTADEARYVHAVLAKDDKKYADVKKELLSVHPGAANPPAKPVKDPDPQAIADKNGADFTFDGDTFNLRYEVQKQTFKIGKETIVKYYGHLYITYKGEDRTLPDKKIETFYELESDDAPGKPKITRKTDRLPIKGRPDQVTDLFLIDVYGDGKTQTLAIQHETIINDKLNPPARRHMLATGSGEGKGLLRMEQREIQVTPKDAVPAEKGGGDKRGGGGRTGALPTPKRGVMLAMAPPRRSGVVSDTQVAFFGGDADEKQEEGAPRLKPTVSTSAASFVPPAASTLKSAQKNLDDLLAGKVAGFGEGNADFKKLQAELKDQIAAAEKDPRRGTDRNRSLGAMNLSDVLARTRYALIVLDDYGKKDHYLSDLADDALEMVKQTRKLFEDAVFLALENDERAAAALDKAQKSLASLPYRLNELQLKKGAGAERLILEQKKVYTQIVAARTFHKTQPALDKLFTKAGKDDLGIENRRPLDVWLGLLTGDRPKADRDLMFLDVLRKGAADGDPAVGRIVAERTADAQQNLVIMAMRLQYEQMIILRATLDRPLDKSVLGNSQYAVADKYVTSLDGLLAKIEKLNRLIDLPAGDIKKIVAVLEDDKIDDKTRADELRKLGVETLSDKDVARIMSQYKGGKSEGAVRRKALDALYGVRMPDAERRKKLQEVLEEYQKLVASNLERDEKGQPLRKEGGDIKTPEEKWTQFDRDMHSVEERLKTLGMIDMTGKIIAIIVVASLTGGAAGGTAGTLLTGVWTTAPAFVVGTVEVLAFAAAFTWVVREANEQILGVPNEKSFVREWLTNAAMFGFLRATAALYGAYVQLPAEVEKVTRAQYLLWHAGRIGVAYVSLWAFAEADHYFLEKGRLMNREERIRMLISNGLLVAGLELARVVTGPIEAQLRGVIGKLASPLYRNQLARFNAQRALIDAKMAEVERNPTDAKARAELQKMVERQWNAEVEFLKRAARNGAITGKELDEVLLNWTQAAFSAEYKLAQLGIDIPIQSIWGFRPMPGRTGSVIFNDADDSALAFLLKEGYQIEKFSPELFIATKGNERIELVPKSKYYDGLFGKLEPPSGLKPADSTNPAKIETAPLKENPTRFRVVPGEPFREAPQAFFDKSLKLVNGKPQLKPGTYVWAIDADGQLWMAAKGEGVVLPEARIAGEMVVAPNGKITITNESQHFGKYKDRGRAQLDNARELMKQLGLEIEGAKYTPQDLVDPPARTRPLPTKPEARPPEAVLMLAFDEPLTKLAHDAKLDVQTTSILRGLRHDRMIEVEYGDGGPKRTKARMTVAEAIEKAGKPNVEGMRVLEIDPAKTAVDPNAVAEKFPGDWLTKANGGFDKIPTSVVVTFKSGRIAVFHGNKDMLLELAADPNVDSIKPGDGPSWTPTTFGIPVAERQVDFDAVGALKKQLGPDVGTTIDKMDLGEKGGAKILHGTFAGAEPSVRRGPLNVGKGFGGRGLYLFLGEDGRVAQEYADIAGREADARVEQNPELGLPKQDSAGKKPVVLKGQLNPNARNDAGQPLRVGRFTVLRNAKPDLKRGVLPADWADDPVLRQLLEREYDVLDIKIDPRDLNLDAKRILIVHESAGPDAITWERSDSTLKMADDIAARPKVNPRTDLGRHIADAEKAADTLGEKVGGKLGPSVARAEKLAAGGDANFETISRVMDPVFGKDAIDAIKKADGPTREKWQETADKIIATLRDSKLSLEERRAEVKRLLGELETTLKGAKDVDVAKFKFAQAITQLEGVNEANFGKRIKVGPDGMLTDAEGKPVKDAEGKAMHLEDLLKMLDAVNKYYYDNGVRRDLALSMSQGGEVMIITRKPFQMPTPQGLPPRLPAMDVPAGASVVDPAAGAFESCYPLDMLNQADLGRPIYLMEYDPNYTGRALMRSSDGRVTWENAVPRTGGRTVILADPLQTMGSMLKPRSVGKVFLNNINAHYQAPQYDVLAKQLLKVMIENGTVDVQWDTTPENTRGDSRGHIDGEQLVKALERAIASDPAFRGRTISVDKGQPPIKGYPYSPEASRVRGSGKTADLKGIIPPQPNMRWVIRFDPK